MWKWLRMKFSAGLLNNGDWQWRPAATSSIAQHAMFEIRVSSRGDVLCFETNTQMRSRVTPSRLAIRASRKQSQPLHDVERQGDTKEEAKRYVGERSDETGDGVCCVRG